MRTIILLSLLLLNDTYCQVPEPKKFYFKFVENAENFNGSSDEIDGLTMKFDFYNKDQKIGIGGGWLIYKKGTLAGDKLAKKLYPDDNFKGILFVKDMFQINQSNPQVDKMMMKEFDVYLYLIDPKYLELRLNTDGEGAGKTYSYYEKYPLNIVIYKQEAGKDYFVKCGIYSVNNEDEFLETRKIISDFKTKTEINSNKSR
jgi:hypothetical protein